MFIFPLVCPSFFSLFFYVAEQNKERVGEGEEEKTCGFIFYFYMEKKKKRPHFDILIKRLVVLCSFSSTKRIIYIIKDS
jgi:hypothetical protein